MGFVTVSLALALFLTVYGFLFLWLSQKLGDSDAIRSGKLIFLFAFLYFALAHFGVLNAVGLSLEEDYTAPCEVVLVNESKNICDIDHRYKYGENYSGYHWDYMTSPPSCNPNDLDCVKLFHINATALGCEELITYSYGDSCDGTTPAAASTLFTIYLWLLWIDAFAIFLGTAAAFIAWFNKRW